MALWALVNNKQEKVAANSNKKTKKKQNFTAVVSGQLQTVYLKGFLLRIVVVGIQRQANFASKPVKPTNQPASQLLTTTSWGSEW